MGKSKSKPSVDSEFTFTPQINTASRKLALQTVYGTKNPEGNSEENTPRFMQYTAARRESVAELAPLKKVPYCKVRSHSLGGDLTSLPAGTIKPPHHQNEPLKPVLGRRTSLGSFELQSKNNPSLGAKNRDGLTAEENIAGKQGVNMSLPEYNAETFTFRPKVSLQSTKIAESLGTDFMERQQQHLEKQRKHAEQANLHYRNGRLSPVQQQRAARRASKDLTKSVSVTKDGNESDEEKENLPSPTSTGESASNTTVKASRSGGNLAPVRAPKKAQSSNGLQRLSENRTEETVPVTSRSKTMPPPDTGRRMSRKVSMTMLDLDRLKTAKTTVERAIKTGKIFTIQGPYAKVRASLRKRGWVEKFYKVQPKVKKMPRTKKTKRDDDDDDDDNDDGDSSGDDDYDDKPDDKNYVPPWEEEGGVYGIMSRMVRNVTPSLIWCLRRDAVDYRFLGRDQMVNHYCRAGSFTTKVGLCVNMRNVPWFESENPDAFFPRCYRLSAEDDKEAFIADYRLTSCMNLVKLVVEEHERRMMGLPEDEPEPEPEPSKKEDKGVASKSDVTAAPAAPPAQPAAKNKKTARKKKGGHVPLKCLELAMHQCEKWLQAQQHLDIDRLEDPATVSDEMWEQFLAWYYQVVHDGATIVNADSRMHECDALVDELRAAGPQFDLDGTRNTWIVKPGAKSRGRGIMVFDRLDEMLKLVAGTVVKKEGKYVVQKYIERPLLVYNTKFDIRQWFLVTDWNPLTIWFYRDSYLRFCSQQYTLEKFDEAIHLANNSIQKYYSNDKTRSSKLPSHNMWAHETFKEYLTERGHPDAWEKIIYPGMRKAICCALLTSQDFVEYRKAAFELYGADFMLTEDLKPWLIEINSSPAMDPSTPVTARMCTNVLEDTMRVVVDRRYDKNCDIGRFELAYRQTSVNVPPYIGINLSVEGTSIRRLGLLQPHIQRLTAPTTDAEPSHVTSSYSAPLTHAKSSTFEHIPLKLTSNTSVRTQSPKSPARQVTSPVLSKKEPTPAKAKPKEEKAKVKEKSASAVVKTHMATVVELKKATATKSQGPPDVSLQDGAWGRLCSRCGSAMSTGDVVCTCASPRHSRCDVPSRAKSARTYQPSYVSLSNQFSPPQPSTPPPLAYSERIPRLSVIRHQILNMDAAINSRRPRQAAKRQSTPGHMNNNIFPGRFNVKRPTRRSGSQYGVYLARSPSLINVVAQGLPR